MKTLIKVTSKNYNSQSQVNYFEKGITKNEIKEFLTGNRNIKVLEEVEEKDVLCKSQIIVKFEGGLEYLSNVNSI